jgi:hypothetical protein
MQTDRQSCTKHDPDQRQYSHDHSLAFELGDGVVISWIP